MPSLRPSPTASATLFALGTTRIGNNGKMWQVVTTSKGVHRWQQVKDARFLHTILFCEPSPQLIGIEFQVSHEFLKVLMRKPKEIDGEDENAFVFGPMFPLDTYVHLGSHGNDAARTGLVDVTNLSKAQRETLETEFSNGWEEKVGFGYTWSDVLRARKTLSPRILFFGETVGGDVGADLWAHRRPNGEIDSIIIDNCMLFECI